MRVSGLDSAGIGTLFSSLSTSSNSTSMFGNTTSMLGDYYSIRSGSYHKLLRAYYQENSSKVDSTKQDDTTKEDTKVNTEKRQMTEMKQEAAALSESADELLERGTNSLFKKTQQTDEKGQTSYQYNTDAIYNAVKNFVDAYNDVLESGQSSNVNSIVNNTSNMMSATASNSSLLKNIGITIDKEHKLSIDKETFQKSDMAVVQSLFNTQGGYGYQISVKAQMIGNAADLRLSNGNYTKNGALSMSNLMSSYESYI